MTGIEMLAVIEKSLDGLDEQEHSVGMAVLSLLRRHEAAIAQLGGAKGPKLPEQILTFDEWCVRHCGGLSVAVTERERMRSAWYSSALAERERIAQKLMETFGSHRTLVWSLEDVVRLVRESAP